MKKETLYRCEICNTQYADKDRANKCESGHKMPISVSPIKYHPIGVYSSGYPIIVEVAFSDGKTKMYKLD